MIRSMTGYGEAERDSAVGRLRVELRTVNHRYFSLNLRAPSSLERHEAEIKEWLRAELPRGHVNCAIRLVDGSDADAGPTLRFNEERGREYLRVLEAMKQRLGLGGEVSVELMSRLPGVLEQSETEPLELPLTDVRDVVTAALAGVVAMRGEEGERLRLDLEGRLRAIEEATAVVSSRAPARLLAERDRLRSAVRELAPDAGVDEERLAREIAFLAERWDIGEELVRLASHIVAFREILGSDDTEPAGKRLGFLVQEMHREANTMGSKANDATIEHQVVAIKNEIERLREQVDNIE